VPLGEVLNLIQQPNAGGDVDTELVLISLGQELDESVAADGQALHCQGWGRVVPPVEEPDRVVHEANIVAKLLCLHFGEVVGPALNATDESLCMGDMI